MATKKLSELLSLETVSANLELTVIPVLDTSTGMTKKVTLQQLNDAIEANIPFAAAAFTQANTPSQVANSASSYANGAFSRANTANSNASNADSKAVSAGVYANAAFDVANSAYATANIATNYTNSNVAAYLTTANISTTGNITSNYFIGNGSQLANISTSFDDEMHVSKDGNDSTGTGTILRPYLTITHALTQVAGGRNTIVIHPGGYTENPTITSLATQLITYDATGASTLVSGTVTIANTTGRIAGLKMNNLDITGNAQAYINSSTVDGQFTKSSSGYVEVDDCELQVTGNVLISGSGITTIIGNKINNLVVNNAGAQVLIKGANDCVMPQVLAGGLNIVDSLIRASSTTANAVTASAGSVVTLMNDQIVTPAADNVARVSIAGFHSIISVIYDKANSALSNSLNSVVYFQTANVDSLVSSGNVTGSNILTGGLISATGNITGNYFIGDGSLLTGITDNVADQKAATAGSYANSAYETANTADQKAVTAGSYANSAYETANTADQKAVTSGDYANSAYGAANTADQKAVTSGDYANSAYGAANTANTYVAAYAAIWDTSPPTTIQSAIDRLANAIYILNSNTPIL
jgi:hypothetical protein